MDNDGTHDGVPADTANLDTDWNGRLEKVFIYGFPDARPEILDNCPGVSNPGQEDVDGDGIGDACDVSEVPALAAGAVVPLGMLLALLGVAFLRRPLATR